jgi:uncharacterized protein (DUF1684 family)
MLKSKQPIPASVSDWSESPRAQALQLADWRRQIAELYASIRASDDPFRAWRLWRGSRDSLFATHPQSPLPAGARAGFEEISVFDYQPGLRFEVFVSELDAKALAAPSPGSPVPLLPVFQTIGLELRLGRELTIYWTDVYGGGLFLPFRDATSGRETYGGGRYLLDGIKGADLGTTRDGRLILDFNFAYHPSCAHDPKWSCPLSPRSNWLDVPVRAGERLP